MVSRPVLTSKPLTSTLTSVTPELTIGRIVKERRTALGLTRRQLSEQAGVSASSIARLELSDFAPKIEPLGKLCAVLDLDLAELMLHRAAS